MSTELNLTAEWFRSQNKRPLHAGDDYDFKVQLQRNAAPLPLTSGKVWLTVKEASLKADTEAKLQLSSASSAEIEITDVPNGKVTVKFRGGSGASKPTDDLEGQWSYDLQVKALIDGVAKVMTVAYGFIEFLPNITRSTT